MTFKEIYILTTRFWPPDIDISDGTMVEKNGGNFPILSQFWDRAELKTQKESDFIKLMVWGIYCAYHKKAIEKYQNGKGTVSLSELDMDYLKYKFEESLFDKESNFYAELRADYKDE